MQVEVKLDAACTEPKVLILTAQLTEEVAALAQRLSEAAPQALVGFREDEAVLLEQAELIRIYAEGGKVFAVTAQGRFQLRMRLYALEERLDRRSFVRISNAEIVNLKKVKSFDLRLSGTICVRLCDGASTYVSRRYVKRIKTVLGL